MTTNSTNKTNLRRSRRRGFTLTEIAIVLGIVGLILGSIWVAAAAVYNNMRIAHANTAVLQIAQAIRGFYGNVSTDAGLTIPILSQANILPQDLVIAPGAAATMVSPFPGGNTFIVPTGDNMGFQISMTGVNVSTCIAMLMAVGGQNHDPGLFMATGTAGAAPAALATGAPIAIVATPTLANTAAGGGFGGCNIAALTAVNFGFSLKS